MQYYFLVSILAEIEWNFIRYIPIKKCMKIECTINMKMASVIKTKFCKLEIHLNNREESTSGK